MNSETRDEIKSNQTLLQMELEKEKLRAEMGGRNFNVDDIPSCRVCGKDLSKGGGRVNDHLGCPIGFNTINQPICYSCSKDKPDEYHIAFKKQFWNREE